MNAKQFCEKHGKKYKSKIPQWYKAGYLPGASRNEKTGVYDIPDDILVPYIGGGHVKNISTLVNKLLEAANNENSVFPGLFPKIREKTFIEAKNNLILNDLITVTYTGGGQEYYILTSKGVQFMNETGDNATRQKIIIKIFNLVTAGLSFAAAMAQILPYWAK